MIIRYNNGSKKLRPFIGILFKINNCMYFAPLSSPKPKHLKMVSKLDFLKIDFGKLGAVNFNNMLPVTEKNVVLIDLNKKGFTKTEKEYLNLLNKQIYWLNRHCDILYNNSKNLYLKYINGTLDSRTRNRYCNFKLLEEKCYEYNEAKIKM